MKNDFSELCNKLEKCNKRCMQNPIKCVRCHLKQYGEGDYDMFLKIKTEAEAMDIHHLEKEILDFLSLPVAIFALLYNIAEEWKCKERYGIVVFLGVVFLGLVALYKSEKNSNMKKWKKYVIIVIKEVEEEMENK